MSASGYAIICLKMLRVSVIRHRRELWRQLLSCDNAARLPRVVGDPFGLGSGWNSSGGHVIAVDSDVTHTRRSGSVGAAVARELLDTLSTTALT